MSTTPGSSPSTEAPPSGANSLRGAGLRYGASDGVPQWAIGKTADEILNIASQAVSYIQSAQPATQPVSTPDVRTQSAAAPDPELAYSNPTEYARQYDAYNAARMQQAMSAYAAPVLGQLSELARQQSRNGAYADVWRRWEPEIELKLAGIPRESRTLPLYEQAAALVKADHLEELARERAEQLAANVGGAGTERSPSGSVASGALAEDPLEKAFASGHPFFEKARAEGLTPERVRRFLEQTGRTVDEYIANATRGNVVASAAGFVRAHG